MSDTAVMHHRANCMEQLFASNTLYRNLSPTATQGRDTRSSVNQTEFSMEPAYITMDENGIRDGRPRNGNSISGMDTDYALPGKVQNISRVHPPSYPLGMGYFSGYFSPDLKQPSSAKVASLLIYTSKSRRFSLNGIQLSLGRGQNFTSYYSFKLFLKNQFHY